MSKVTTQTAKKMARRESTIHLTAFTPIDAVVYSDHTFDKLVEDNKQYDSGYDNARKQK
jgi:hypothetical protein